MTFSYRKTITYRLAQAAKAHRARAGSHLGRIGLHPGQETVLKLLAEQDGQTMSQLAQALSVQPPTVTKMITRLSAQGFVRRVASESDGRLARVQLTETGRLKIEDIDKAWKRLEKEALAGFDDKDRKRLRKLLREIERNLSGAVIPPEEESPPEEEPAEDEAEA
ncbi:MarR family winged helix-turn-helix transcriptional regulator [Prosthecomicrobium sp. N25]|uniref:MarR family winged helix-turn-helix transcriptional regulator n=1 Tax=Prosthecomicrobium sp. N25 TaxID=3129254 RepID=UPI0030775E7E